MREILFRAKWIGNGKWMEGYYCKISETTYAFAEDYERNPIPIHHYILQEVMTDWGLPNRFNQYEIDPETLCQYTGLKDKSGNRIWENDIVKIGANTLVRWNGKYAGWCLTQKGWMYDHFFGEAISPCDCEVVGNVFDNPDLFELRTGH